MAAWQHGDAQAIERVAGGVWHQAAAHIGARRDHLHPKVKRMPLPRPNGLMVAAAPGLQGGHHASNAFLANLHAPAYAAVL